MPWDFFGRNDAKAETPVLWPPHAKSWLIGKDSDVGRDWGQGGEGDDRGWDGWMASPTRWTWIRVNSGSWWWTGSPGVLRFRGRKESDTTELLNWTELNWGSVAKSLYYKVTALQSKFCWERYFELCKYPFILKNFHLFMYLFTRVRTPDFQFYSMFNALLSFILMLKFFLIYPVGAHCCWLWFLLDMSLSFFPGEGKGNPLQYSCLENPHGQRSLADFSPWGCKESDTTEWLSTIILWAFPFWKPEL